MSKMSGRAIARRNAGRFRRRYRKGGKPWPKFRKSTTKLKAGRWSGTSRWAKRKQGFHNKVQRALNSIAETQFKSYSTGVSATDAQNGLGIENSLLPLQFAQDMDKYQVSFNVGAAGMARQTAQITPGEGLKMFNLPASGASGRDGAYVSMIKNKLRLLVTRDPIYNEAPSDALSSIERTALLAAPMNFRLMIIKPNMKYHRDAPIANNHCWLAANGTDTGYDVTKFSALQFNNLLMNKKNYTVLADKRFKLNAPAVVNDTTLTYNAN